METDYISQHFINFHVCIDIFQLMHQCFRGAVHWWACAVPLGDFADCPHARRGGLECYLREQWTPVVLQTASLAGAQPLVPMFFFWRRSECTFALCSVSTDEGQGTMELSLAYRGQSQSTGSAPQSQMNAGILWSDFRAHWKASWRDVTFLFWLSWLTFSSMKVIMWCVPAWLQRALHMDVYEDLC